MACGYTTNRSHGLTVYEHTQQQNVIFWMASTFIYGRISCTVHECSVSPRRIEIPRAARHRIPSDGRKRWFRLNKKPGKPIAATPSKSRGQIAHAHTHTLHLMTAHGGPESIVRLRGGAASGIVCTRCTRCTVPPLGELCPEFQIEGPDGQRCGA